MIKLNANGAKKYINDEFIDVKLFDLSRAFKFLGSQPKSVIEWLQDSEKVCDYQEQINFKIGWISFFSNFTIDELKLVPFEITNESLSIDFLFNLCSKFLKHPEVHLDLKEIKIHGKKYSIIEPIKTISGAKMLFGNANYRQWMLLTQISKIVEENKNEKCIDGLVNLLAVIYTDGDDSDIALKERVEAFKEIDALNGWSGYFFFALLLNKYNDYFQSYSNGRTNLKAQQKLNLEQLKENFSRTLIGKSLRLKSLKWEYSILQD